MRVFLKREAGLPMIYPDRLNLGDTIGIIAPAGPPNEENLQNGICFLERMGLRIKLGAHIHQVHGYLAGTDMERLRDFHDMIEDSEVKGIIFARGGYGTGRIANMIDYELIKRNPKIIWGYSDITYLHTAIRQKTGLVTFHGPMVGSDIGKENFDQLSGHLLHQLFEPTKLTYSEAVSPLFTYAEGGATGALVGGNLSLIVSTLGTPFEIDTAGKILLLEDIGEEPYRVDSMLNQLRLAGKLSESVGIVIGDFAEAVPKVQPSLSLDQVFLDYFSDFNGPVLGGFKIGHCFPHFSVPFGVEARLSTDDKLLCIDPGVK